MRDDEARPGPALDDHIAQVPVVALHVALPRARAQALLEELADRNEEHAVPGLPVGASGAGRSVEAGYAERSGGPDRADERVQDRRRFLAVGAARRRLVADGVDALVRADAFGPVLDLLHGVALGEVDRNRTDLPGLFQPFGNAVHDEDLLRAAQQGRVGGHEPDRPAAVHGDALTWADPGELTAVVADLWSPRPTCRISRDSSLMISPTASARTSPTADPGADGGPHRHRVPGHSSMPERSAPATMWRWSTRKTTSRGRIETAAAMNSSCRLTV